LSKLILASASPRRWELFARLKLPFNVKPIEVHERAPARGNPEIIARRLARTKAVAARLVDRDALIVAADTVVAVEGSILGKPVDAKDAHWMLKLLRAREHEVVSAVAVMPGGRSPLMRHPVTRVVMRDFAAGEIEASIARGDPFDKAGAYAIQDEAFRPVERYDGCYCNVVGLSLWATIELLRKVDVDVSAGAESDLLPQCALCPLRPAGV